MAITTTIVQINAQVQSAPTAPALQQAGAFVSVGGTTQTEGTIQFYDSAEAIVNVISSEGNYLEVGYMNSTFWAQGNAVGAYILELGVQGTVAAGITALAAWITANSNPQLIYAYLCPASWDASGAALDSLAANYSSPTGKTYFFVTTTSGTISAYLSTTKSIFTFVPSPTAAASEFQAAAGFYQWISNNPSVAVPAAPMQYRFLYGVTPWAPSNNQTTLTNILTVFGNVVYTGAEGGISTACLFKGTTMDGNQSMFWWAVNWFQINVKQQLANAVINGSNGAPLPYNQQGINTLLKVAQNLGKTGSTIGLLLSSVVTAQSFSAYTQANPGAYAAGQYGGFTATITPQLGFGTITFNIDATQFVSA